MCAAARLIDRLISPLVPLSFTAPGYRLRASGWDEDDLDVDLTGRVCAITGANAGLGRATAGALADLGANVVLVGRNAERLATARNELVEATGNHALSTELCDVGELDQVASLARTIEDRYGRLDVLVHNAGVLLDSRQRTGDGHETTFAINVLGPFRLTAELRSLMERSAPSRIVHVSSGGMYTQRLDLDALTDPPEPFDGVRAYAQTKRAQVILSELWAEELAGTGVSSNAMHPGWADTPGVRRSLPRFHKVTRAVLRNARQGADSIVWLAASPTAEKLNGSFVFDRRPRSAYLLPATRETDTERQRLWELCRDLAGVSDLRAD